MPGSPDELMDLIDDDGNPNTGFRIDFLSGEYDCRIEFRVWEPGVYIPPAVKSPEILVAASPNPQSIFVPFAQFTQTQGTTPFDWTNVYSIQFTVYSAPDGDYEIDNMSVGVPEPATLLVVAAGAAGMLRRRKRARG